MEIGFVFHELLRYKKIRSVVDNYVASYIELCEFESRQGRFLQMFFFIFYSFTYMCISTFLCCRTFFLFFLSIFS